MAAVVAVVISLFSGGSGDIKSRASVPPSAVSTPAMTQPSSVPPVTSSPSPSSKVTAPTFTYLSDLNPVGGSAAADQGSDVTIDGTDYPHSVVIFCLGSDVMGQQDNNIEYDIGLRGKEFQGLVGIGDTEDASGIKADVSFYGDGKLLQTAQTALGHPIAVKFSLVGVLRLRISIYVVQSMWDGRNPHVSIADARFS